MSSELPSEGKSIASSRHNKRQNIVLLILSLLGLLTFTSIGILSVQDHTGADAPQCRPIYMYPSYARVTGFDTSHTKFASKYNLFLYREQGKDKVPTEGDPRLLDGIPVLFIPGNAGSYKQVRSIAAEATNIYQSHKNEDRFQGRNLDFFAAHFNEDFTAFHGRTMLDQAEYLNDAIRFILSLYSESPNPPTSVILVGHSMGGVVSRVMLTLPNYVENSVNTIITLAAPHAAAPATFDSDIMKIYGATDKFWRAGFEKEGSDLSTQRLKHVSLISITGGLLDTILPADYTTLDGLVPDTNGFTMYTTGIPRVWTPIDHLAIVWCDQLRKAVASVLLDIVDPSSPTRTYDLQKRMLLLRHGLLSGFENYAKQDFTSSIKSTGFEIKLDKNNLIVTDGKRNELNSNKIHLFDLQKAQEGSVLNFLSSLQPSDSLENDQDSHLLVCNENGKASESPQAVDFSNGALKENILELECRNIASEIYPVPKSTKDITESSRSSHGGDQNPFYASQINTDLLKNFNYLVYVGASESTFENFATWSIESEDSQQIQVEHSFLSLLFGSKIELPKSKSLVKSIQFNSIVSSLLSFKVKFDIADQSTSFEPFARQWIEDPFETKWHLGLNEEKIISFHGIAPYTPFRLEFNPLHLQIWAPFSELPSKVSIQIDILESLKLWVLRYRLAVVSLPVFIIATTLVLQFLEFSKTGKFPTFRNGLDSFVTIFIPISIGASLLSVFASNSKIQKLLYLIDPVAVTKPGELGDVHVNPYALGLQEKNLWFLGPLFIIIALSLVYTVNLLLLGVVKGTKLSLSQLKKSHASKVLKLNPSDNNIESAASLKFTEKRRIVGTVILLGFVMFYIPYQFAYIVCCVVQGVVCFKASIFKAPLLKDKDNSVQYYNYLNSNMSLFILMLWIVPVNVPVLVVFFHNMAVRWETPFSSHHNILAILPIILLVGKNVQGHVLPQPQYSPQRRITVFLLSYFAFFSLVYGVRHLYWLHHLLNFFCAWLFILFYEGSQSII